VERGYWDVHDDRRRSHGQDARVTVMIQRFGRWIIGGEGELFG
jgi:hypothetical protein